jgi:hypothetical protein
MNGATAPVFAARDLCSKGPTGIESRYKERLTYPVIVHAVIQKGRLSGLLNARGANTPSKTFLVGSFSSTQSASTYSFNVRIGFPV